ncbi:glycine--tRNA ligase [Candidatus Woesearchaeota archaeon]|nr:glycine--tRNA ligase [Candidatus Woesearchaeota archaeon]MBW3013666.1 glycine--tRNA ligase [Candidatus Woesearchaeota archaeon]
MAENDYTKELIRYLAETGFVWGPAPEIYGGLAGFYDYGPLGKLLKNNVENAIRHVFIKNNFWEVECPTIMPAKVWEASGHLSGFTDPMIQCSKCDNGFRVDTLIEEFAGDVKVGGLKDEELLELIDKHNIKCPSCKSSFKKEIIKHNMMMKTKVGVSTEVFNRPETATTTYLPFKRLDEFFRRKLPFGVFQIGKAYRNEISPRQHLLRQREFTQAEGQLFIFGHEKNNFDRFKDVENAELPLWTFDEQTEKAPVKMIKLKDAMSRKVLKNQAYAWTLNVAYQLFVEMGIPKEKVRFRQHDPNELAFYADDAWDVEVKLESFGWTEVCGVHDRTDYDLKQHSKFSGEKLEAYDEEKKERLVPHILEIAFGSDRPTFTLLDIFYDPTDEQRKCLRLPPKLAPIKAGIYPLVNKEKLPDIAKSIYNELIQDFVVTYDKGGSIGRRYARADWRGIPYGITIDFDSMKNNDVTLRERDSQDQVRIKINDVKKIITDLINGTIEFKDLK